MSSAEVRSRQRPSSSKPSLMFPAFSDHAHSDERLKKRRPCHRIHGVRSSPAQGRAQPFGGLLLPMVAAL